MFSKEFAGQGILCTLYREKGSLNDFIAMFFRDKEEEE